MTQIMFPLSRRLVLFLLKLLAVCLSAFEYNGLAIVCLAVVPLLAPVRFVRQAYDDIQM